MYKVNEVEHIDKATSSKNTLFFEPNRDSWALVSSRTSTIHAGPFKW
jgi:hypothetical protein